MKSQSATAPSNGANNEAITKIESVNPVSVCDPEVSAALGNLEEDQIRDSIKNTYMMAVNDPKKKCELPKIYLLELMLTGGITEEQAQGLMTKIGTASSFIQTNIENRSDLKILDKLQIKNKLNSAITNQKSSVSSNSSNAKTEYLIKIKDFCSDPTTNCDDSKLKSELSILLDSLT